MNYKRTPGILQDREGNWERKKKNETKEESWKGSGTQVAGNENEVEVTREQGSQ